MPLVNEEVRAKVKKRYEDQHGIKLQSVEDGVDGVLGGSLAIATYIASPRERISDVVYISSEGEPHVFGSTQELILFLERKTKIVWIDFLFDSRLFSGVVFVFLLLAVFWAGWLQEGGFNDRALTILGSVVGLAAGLFFGVSRK